MIDQSLSPPTIGVVISIAANFSDEIYENLELLISEPESIEPSDEILDEFCEENEISPNDLRYFLPFLRYLYIKTKDMNEDDILLSLQNFIKENSDDGVNSDQVASRLLKLLKFRDIQEAAQKRQRLSQGFLPYLVNVHSFVDIRHDFGRDQDNKLNDQLGEPTTIVQLKLETNSSRAYERYAILQLDRKALEKLKDAMVEIDRKLEIIDKSEST